MPTLLELYQNFIVSQWLIRFLVNMKCTDIIAIKNYRQGYWRMHLNLISMALYAFESTTTDWIPWQSKMLTDTVNRPLSLIVSQNARIPNISRILNILANCNWQRWQGEYNNHIAQWIVQITRLPLSLKRASGRLNGQRLSYCLQSKSSLLWSILMISPATPSP